MSKLKKIPKFKNIQQEQKFWQDHDSSEYIDWKEAKQASFPNLKPSVKSISLRLPEDLLNDIKIIAHRDDIPYQSLIKIMLVREVKKHYG